MVQSERRLAREALVAYLDNTPEFDVVGNTATVDYLSALCSLRRPQLVLVEAEALRMDTIDALRELRTAYPAIGIVVTYVELNPPMLEAAMQAGITSLIPCSNGLHALMQTLRQQTRAGGRDATGGSVLTKRDLEVVSLLSVGHSTPEIARLLAISPHTVENHKRHIYAKLGVGNQSHAVSRATSLGLLDPAVPAPSPARTTGEHGRTVLVVVHGSLGAGTDRVVVALLRNGLPFVLARVSKSLDEDHWVQWHRGPLVVVLVDPASEHWLVPTSLGAPAVVVLSAQPRRKAVVDALLQGAQAVLGGDERSDDLCAVLTLAARGYLGLSPGYADGLVSWIATRSAERHTSQPELTARERDILVSIARGHTVRQTARALGIAAKTVENTQSRLFRKLGTRNRSETLTVAYQMGLIDPARPAVGDVVRAPPALEPGTRADQDANGLAEQSANGLAGQDADPADGTGQTDRDVSRGYSTRRERLASRDCGAC